MRTVKSNYFESKIRRSGISEDGTPCRINEQFVVNSQSFTECEVRITKYISSLYDGEFEVLTENHAPFGEVFFSDVEGEEKFYKCKVAFIVLDERSGKERKQKVTYLVQGSSIDSAKKNLDEVMSQGMSEYSVESIHETPIVDVVNAEKDKKD